MQSRQELALSISALLSLFAFGSASADNWNYGTLLGLSSDWNDNPALADDFIETDSTFRFLASYDGEFERVDDPTTFNFRPRITTDYYPDSKNSDLQATDIFLPGSFSYRRERNLWSLGFSASRQSVLSDEATTSQETPIGVLRGDDTLTQFSATPSLAWQLTEKDELQFGLSYSLSDYDLEFTNRSDTDSVGGNVTYRHSLSERHAVGLTGLFNSSDSDRRALLTVEVLPPTDPPTLQVLEGKVTTDSTSSLITADYDYAVTENSVLNISYGVQDATTESTTKLLNTGQESGLGALDFSSSTFDINYRTEGPRANYTVGASRIVTLDITNGQPQDRYQINFDGDYKITEKLVAGWRILGWTQEAVALEVLDENNLRTNISRQLTYYSAAARLDWQVTRKWYLYGRYEYRNRDTDQSINNFSQNLTATSNQVTVGVSYAWKEMPR